MPFVRGYLRKIRRPHHRPGEPDIGLPEGEIDETPDWGLPEGELPTDPDELPDPPPGIWPPLTPDHPWRPIDPGFGLRPGRPGQGLPPTPGQPPAGGIGGRPPERPGPGEPDEELPPPGTIWPPLPPGVHGKYWGLMLAYGPRGFKWHYVVVDADARPPRPERPERPDGPEVDPTRR